MQGRTKGNAQGIDVSHYQGDIDWKKVAGSGITFAFVKATEGETYKDPTFMRNAEGAADAGLLAGAYHFLKATSAAAARREAQFFLSDRITSCQAAFATGHGLRDESGQS